VSRIGKYLIGWIFVALSIVVANSLLILSIHWGFYILFLNLFLASLIPFFAHQRLWKFCRIRNRFFAIVMGIVVAVFYYFGFYHSIKVYIVGTDALFDIWSTLVFISYSIEKEFIFGDALSWYQFGGECFVLSLLNAAFLWGQSSVPFCKSCDDWKDFMGFSFLPDVGNEILQAIETGKLEPLKTYYSTDGNAYSTALMIEFCGKNGTYDDECEVLFTIKKTSGQNEHCSSTRMHSPIGSFLVHNKLAEGAALGSIRTLMSEEFWSSSYIGPDTQDCTKSAGRIQKCTRIDKYSIQSLANQFFLPVERCIRCEAKADSFQEYRAVFMPMTIISSIGQHLAYHVQVPYCKRCKMQSNLIYGSAMAGALCVLFFIIYLLVSLPYDIGGYLIIAGLISVNTVIPFLAHLLSRILWETICGFSIRMIDSKGKSIVFKHVNIGYIEETIKLINEYDEDFSVSSGVKEEP
jgi:hypothetical protein